MQIIINTINIKVIVFVLIICSLSTQFLFTKNITAIIAIENGIYIIGFIHPIKKNITGKIKYIYDEYFNVFKLIFSSFSFCIY